MQIVCLRQRVQPWGAICAIDMREYSVSYWFIFDNLYLCKKIVEMEPFFVEKGIPEANFLAIDTHVRSFQAIMHCHICQKDSGRYFFLRRYFLKKTPLRLRRFSLPFRHGKKHSAGRQRKGYSAGRQGKGHFSGQRENRY